MFQNLNLNIDDISSTIDENIKSSSINYRGIYKIKSQNNLYFDVCGNSSDNNTPIILYPNNNHNNQKFIIEPLEDTNITSSIQDLLNNISNRKEPNLYSIKALKKKKSLDISSENKANGAKLIQYEYHNGANQHFIIVPINNNNPNLVNIYIAHSNKVLDIPGANFKSKVQIQQYTANNTIAQQFTLEKISDL